MAPLEPAKRWTFLSTSAMLAAGWRICHIAEHRESGMMFSVDVDRARERRGNGKFEGR
jgi:hypothetical protein